MTSTNPFDLLGDDDNDDPSQLIAKLPAIVAAAAPVTKKSPAGGLPAAKLSSKPRPPARAVQVTRTDGQRGEGHFGGRGNGHSNRGNGHGGRGHGFNRDLADTDNSYGYNNTVLNGEYRPLENGDVDKSERRVGFNGPRRGGYSNRDTEGERPRRVFERLSGTGRGNEFKREGSGRGNWGNPTDDVSLEPKEPMVDAEKNVEPEKQDGHEDAVDATKENPLVETEEKEPVEKEMTLEEYEKVLEEKRKALQALKSEERKVDLDKELAKMQLLSNKKSEEDIFAKLGPDKDKRKEAADKEEKARKSLSINEFLKPAEGERYHNPGGRGRGRGRGRGARGGGGNQKNDMAAPAIEDVAQFPLLGVK